MNQELEVGQRWYGTHPGACVVVEVYVDEITEGTVLVRQEGWCFDGLCGVYQSDTKARYRKGEFKFIELLPPKPAHVASWVEVSGSPAPSLWARAKEWLK